MSGKQNLLNKANLQACCFILLTLSVLTITATAKNTSSTAKKTTTTKKTKTNVITCPKRYCSEDRRLFSRNGYDCRIQKQTCYGNEKDCCDETIGCCNKDRERNFGWLFLGLGIAAAVICLGICGWYFCYKQPRDRKRREEENRRMDEEEQNMGNYVIVAAQPMQPQQQGYAYPPPGPGYGYPGPPPGPMYAYPPPPGQFPQGQFPPQPYSQIPTPPPGQSQPVQSQTL